MKGLFQNVSFYLLGSVIGSSLSFFFHPILTSTISVADFGRLSLVLLFVNFASPIINFGTAGAVNKEFYRLEGRSRRIYTFNALLISTIFFLVVIMPFLLLGHSLADYADVEYKFILAVPFMAFGGVVQQFLLTMLRINKKSVSFSVVSVLGGVLNFSLGYLFVVTLKWGLQGRLLSLVILNGILIIICLCFLIKQKYITIHFNREFCKEIVLFGFPIVFHLISAAIIIFTDQLFISMMLGKADLGIYSLGVRLIFPFAILRVNFLNAIDPIRYQLLAVGSSTSKLKLVKILAIYLGFILISILGGLLAYKLLFPYVFSLEYQQAFDVIVILATTVLIDTIYNLFAGQIFFTGRTKIFMYASFFNIAVNVLLNYLMILQYGIYGAAIATLISKFAFTSIIVYTSSTLYKLPWLELRKALKTEIKN